MSAAVRYDGPAHHGSAPARGPGTGEQQPSGPAARPGAALTAHLLAAHAEALFASDLSIWCEYTRIEVTAAIRNAIGIHNGIGGCAGEVAAAYGEHPETAARRMRWARAVIEDLNASTRSRTSRRPAAGCPSADPSWGSELGSFSSLTFLDKLILKI